MNKIRFILIAFPVLLLAQSAKAQVPFFFPGATAFTPEISIVNSGALLDAQATVSADQKYVTLTMRPQNSTLLALRSFNFQQGTAQFGNVGDERRPPNGGNGAPVSSSPSDILAHAKSEASVLHRQGMSRISTLKQ